MKKISGKNEYFFTSSRLASCIIYPRCFYGFFVGFVVGSPTSFSYLSDFSSFGTALYILTIIFENMGYIVACAIGFKIAKESQHGLIAKEILLKDIHLKDSERRKTVERELFANVQWILLSTIFIAVGTLFETLLTVYFR